MRLIDEQTTNEAVRKVLRKYGFNDDSIVSDEVWDCIENEVPTAYDVDKVVEQLEEEKINVPVNRLIDDIINDKPKELGQLMAYNKSIKVVKKGGIE